MSIQVGDRLPEATSKTMTEEGPGAFTPTCSKQHRPGYVKP